MEYPEEEYSIKVVSEQLKSYFKDKINWKLINDITHLVTNYEDAGLFDRYHISAMVHMNHHFETIWNSDRRYFTYGDSISGMILSYEKFGLVYTFEVGPVRGTKNTEMDKIALEILDKLKNKYKIEMLPNTNDTLRFKLMKL